MKRVLFIFLLVQTIMFQFSLHAQMNFTNIAPSMGIDYENSSLESFGPGITFIDFNNDGWDDLSVCTSEGDSMLFFKNNMGVFEPIDFNIADTTVIKQISWVDLDNDGDKDLFITSLSGFRVFENQGELNLSEITSSSGILTGTVPAYSAAWGELNNDGFLDVYLSIRTADGPISNLLYKNNGNLTFSNVTVGAGLFDNQSFSFCGAWFDFNNDGFQDILATTDKLSYVNKLYLNNGDETFTDVSIPAGVFDSMDAMSTTIADYNYDGNLDFYITNTNHGNRFYHNNGNSTFTDTASYNGTIFNNWTWGAAFLDGENDGDLDLYVSAMHRGTDTLSSKFFENDGNGIFSQPNNIGFVGDSAKSHGNAIGDLNNDGYYDIVVSNVDSSLHIWQNGGGSNNYIKINLEGTVSNRDGVGSWIKVYTNGEMQTRYTMSGEGFCSQFSENIIIGVGGETVIDSIEVNWLSGIQDKLYSIPVNQKLTIIEGNSIQEIIYDSIVALCHGESTTIFLNEFDNYLWSDASTADSLSVTEIGTISVQAWMDYCPVQSKTIEVVVSSPNLVLGEDSTRCLGDTLLLVVDDSWMSILWSNNTSNDSLEVIMDGIYYCTVTDTLGCQDSDTIEVFSSIQLSLGEDSTRCFGDTMLLIVDESWMNIDWSDGTTNDSLAISIDGVYFCSVTDTLGCISSDTIEVFSSMPLYLGEDSLACTGDTVIVSIDEVWTSVIWDDGSSYDSIEVTTAGIYYCTVEDINGCEVSDTIQVAFESCDVSINSYNEIVDVRIMPNPSSGVFLIQMDNFQNEIEMVVVNSKGEHVFSDVISSNNHSFDITILPKGIYFLKLLDQSFKLLKSN